MRFNDRLSEHEKALKRITFNSLYEIPDDVNNRRHTTASYLSILSMRFYRARAMRRSKKNMALSILSMRFRKKLKDAVVEIEDISFNSLYEIPRPAGARAIARIPAFQFSL